MNKVLHIALILNINKAYDRKIVAGVARYMREVGNWSLYLEDDPLSKIPDFDNWAGDGIIADLDDLAVYNAVKDSSIPLVGFGGGYGPYCKGGKVPYIFTENTKIATMAAEHLLDRGFRRFGYCGAPANSTNGWSRERREVFNTIVKEKGYSCSHFVGHSPSAKNWHKSQDELKEWLSSLLLPIGIMSANDSIARHILEACQQLEIKIPEEIALIGVDDDEMMCELANPPLTSIIQGTDTLGYKAAELLDCMMKGEEVAIKTVIDPVGISVRQSTEILAIDDKLVAQALAFIRKEACYAILVEDVATHCDVSRSTLEKRFKSVMERSVHAEISIVQLKKAKELLIHTDLPLKRIFAMAGFSTIQYMSLKFKSESGMTPNQFRRKFRR
ncbi:MAG: DNA-binding transcriptional regulator [Lentisphaeraceae bacterium]|nr:DNA-binding transcriptional regulator [Lentisphaeraceae bacterium]